MLQNQVNPAMTEKNGLPTPPQDSSPPPAYVPQINNESSTPPPDITAAFSNLKLEASGFPTEDQCLAHLKLLEVIHLLRGDISSRDGLFNIWDSFATDKMQKEKHRITIREKRWAVYVAKAVHRFTIWRSHSVLSETDRLTYTNFSAKMAQFRAGGPASTIADLPPLGKNILKHSIIHIANVLYQM